MAENKGRGGGRRKGFDGQYMSIQISFFMSDPRFILLPLGARHTYLTLWALSTRFKRERLPAMYCSARYIAGEGKIDRGTVTRGLWYLRANAAHMSGRSDADAAHMPGICRAYAEYLRANATSKPLLKFHNNGDVTVYGTKEIHSNLRFKEHDPEGTNTEPIKPVKMSKEQISKELNGGCDFIPSFYYRKLFQKITDFEAEALDKFLYGYPPELLKKSFEINHSYWKSQRRQAAENIKRQSDWVTPPTKFEFRSEADTYCLHCFKEREFICEQCKRVVLLKADYHDFKAGKRISLKSIHEALKLVGAERAEFIERKK